MFLFTLFSNFSVNFTFFSLFIVQKLVIKYIICTMLFFSMMILWQEDHMIMMILVLVEFVKNDNVFPWQWWVWQGWFSWWRWYWRHIWKSLSLRPLNKNWLKISFFEFAPRSDVGVVHVEAGWRRGGQGARVESWRVGGRGGGEATRGHCSSGVTRSQGPPVT